MKRMKLRVLFLVAAVSILAVGSAALATVNFERNADARILVDTDDNVAIQIINTSNYDRLVKTAPNGKVSFDLNEAINNKANNGFNPDAIFTVGSPTNGVIKIKNNSDIPVTVTMNSAGDNAISILPVNSSEATIGVGSSSDFYFTIDTNGRSALENLNSVVKIEGR